MLRYFKCLAASFFIIYGVSASAQFAATDPTSTESHSNIEGFWVGVDMCGRRGYVEFFEIGEFRGRLKGEYWWFGSQTGTREIDITPTPDGYFFEGQNIVHFDFVLESGVLVGVGRSQNCKSRLWRVSEEVFRELKGG